MRYLLMNYLTKALFSIEVSKQNQTNIFSYQTYMNFALEKHLSLIDYNFIKKCRQKTALITDFMSQIRKMPFSKFYVFRDVFNAVWNSIQYISQFQQLYIVFNSYLQHCVKDSAQRQHANLWG